MLIIHHEINIVSVALLTMRNLMATITLVGTRECSFFKLFMQYAIEHRSYSLDSIILKANSME